MAGLAPAIHHSSQDSALSRAMDARVKPAHDGSECGCDCAA
ncbi:ABC transporter [Rhodopseudomonas sp. WA056]|nr:ABC transporter [Rhodopseudomonas sp. WA056]